MLRAIREDRRMTQKEMGELIGEPAYLVSAYEIRNDKTTNVITKYINNVRLTVDEDRMLRNIRKNNWKYKHDKSPISNELRRIRNGLGITGGEISEVLGRFSSYWLQLEDYGSPIPEEDLDRLDEHFNLSSTTIKRLRLAVEYTKKDRQPTEALMNENPEVIEPDDLYDDRIITTERGTYLDLLRMIEDENGGSVSNASEDDPKLIRLREMMGVIYYDEDEEHRRVSNNIEWNDVL